MLVNDRLHLTAAASVMGRGRGGGCGAGGRQMKRSVLLSPYRRGGLFYEVARRSG